MDEQKCYISRAVNFPFSRRSLSCFGDIHWILHFNSASCAVVGVLMGVRGIVLMHFALSPSIPPIHPLEPACHVLTHFSSREYDASELPSGANAKADMIPWCPSRSRHFVAVRKSYIMISFPLVPTAKRWLR